MTTPKKSKATPTHSPGEQAPEPAAEVVVVDNLSQIVREGDDPVVINTPPGSPQVTASQALASDTDSAAHDEEDADSHRSSQHDDDSEIQESADPRACNSLDDSLGYQEEDYEATLPASQAKPSSARSKADSLDDFQDPPVRGRVSARSFQHTISQAVDKVMKGPMYLLDDKIPEWRSNAMHIPMPELFKWITERSEFSYDIAGPDSRRSRKGLASLKLLPPPDQAGPFFGLSSSTGLTAAFEEYAQQFADYRVPQISTSIGKFKAAKDPSSVNMNPYKLSDKAIQMEPLKPPAEGFDFVSALKTNYRSTVREEDLTRLEENLRKSLVVLSNADAGMAAVLYEYPHKPDPDSLLMRSLFRVTQSLQVMMDFTISSLHQVVIHRRDTALDARMHAVNRRPAVISDEHLRQLRYGPIPVSYTHLTLPTKA